MNYAEMNDSQINILVCKALGKGMSSYCRIISMNDHTILLADNHTLFDPCNSWADAAPIIQSSGISVSCFKNSMTTAWDSSKGLALGAVFNAPNPLRAAMIVFLMMQENK